MAKRRSSVVLFGGAISAILLALLLTRLFYSPPDYNFVCSESDLTSSDPPPPGECFIRENYRESKDQFLNLSKKCGAELHELPVIEDLNLTIDIAIFRGSPDRFLVHLSGTHGVEGYSGSSIQAAYLHSLCVANRNPYPSETLPTMIFVHSVNPFGFHFNRRVNEDNVDLNRNFLTPEQFEAFQKRDPNHSGYESLTEVFNPRYPPLASALLNDLIGFWNSLRVLSQVGFSTIKGAFVAGTYHNPDGLYYGGRSSSASVRLLREFFSRLDVGIRSAKRYVFIDVHTGLGPSGVDTLMIHDEEAGCRVRTEKYFPTEYSSSEKQKLEPIGGIKPWLSGDAGAVEEGYEKAAGFTTDYFCGSMMGSFSPSSRVCVTQEFGTYPTLLMAKGLIDENQAYHHGTEEQKKFYGERLKRLFFTHTKEWVRSVVRRGTLVISQGLDFLRD